jgi:hypothetical protein
MDRRNKITRRAFCRQMLSGGLVAGALLRGAATDASQSSPPSPPTNLRFPGGKSLLSQSDFTYLGYYSVEGNFGGDVGWGQGFTHRYVGGQLRFLTFGYSSPLMLLELAPPANFGGAVSQTNQWNDIWNGGFDTAGKWVGIWWDESAQRLWSTSAIDYPDDSYINSTKTIHTRTLSSNGTVSNIKGQIGLAGVGARRIYGGAQAVPSWFQSRYGVGPYVVGWGGYASRMAQGLPVSLGPTMYSIPDPSGFSNNADIPTGQFKTIMDCGSGTRADDWYASGAPTSFDRGVRNSNVSNEFDSPGWQSPAPDGLGRWTWGDSNYNTGCWIDGPGKHGFILVPSFSSGRAWYQTSTLNWAYRSSEIQIYDPSRFAEVLAGSRAVWDVKPTSRWTISLPGMVQTTGSGNDGLLYDVLGASYDSTTKRLYIYYLSWSTGNHIYVYSVNC